MARHLFGDIGAFAVAAGSSETVGTITGNHTLLVPSVFITLWNAPTGGTQYTDLQDTTGNPITSVTTDANGAIPQFWGPDGVTVVYADAGGDRRALAAIDLGDSLDGLQTQLDSLALDDLADVAASGAANGNALIYVASTGMWSPGAAGSGGSGTLGGLADVALTTLADRNVLQFNSTAAKWKNVNLDSQYVPLAGGTMTGPLKVNATGNTASSFPLGFTDATDKGIDLIGSFTGGPGVPGTDTDSTARINAYVYQQNQGTASAQHGQFGEILRAFTMKSWAHPTLAFYGPTGGFTANVAGPPVSGGDPQGNWQPIGWLGAQFTDILGNGATTFKHIALEVPDKTNGYMIGRLIIPFGDTTTALSDIGLDTTNIHTNAANFVVSGSNRLGVCGAAGTNRSIELSSETVPAIFSATKTRWKISANNTAESGANAGSDFVIEGFGDTGTSTGKWLTITRATGAMLMPSGSALTIGAATALGTSSRVQVVWGTSGMHGILAQPTASPGTSATLASWLTAATDRTLDSRVASDTSGRLVVYADGKHEWGPGNAGRDVNLYRSAAATIKTDNNLSVGGNIGFYGTTPAAKPTVTGSRGSNAALASLLTALAGLGLLTDSST